MINIITYTREPIFRVEPDIVDKIKADAMNQLLNTYRNEIFNMGKVFITHQVSHDNSGESIRFELGIVKCPWS